MRRLVAPLCLCWKQAGIKPGRINEPLKSLRVCGDWDETKVRGPDLSALYYHSVIQLFMSAHEYENFEWLSRQASRQAGNPICEVLVFFVISACGYLTYKPKSFCKGPEKYGEIKQNKTKCILFFSPWYSDSFLRHCLFHNLEKLCKNCRKFSGAATKFLHFWRFSQCRALCLWKLFGSQK